MYVRMCVITNQLWPEHRVMCNHVPWKSKGNPPDMTKVSCLACGERYNWASKFPPWTGWMTPVNLPAFEDCDGLHGFQSWDMGGWPNLASEKLEALRVIDKVVYTWYPRDSSRLREWDKVVVPRTAPACT